VIAGRAPGALPTGSFPDAATTSSASGTEAASRPDAQAARVRADIATAARIVVKVGSSSLTTPDGEIDGEAIAALAAALAARRQARPGAGPGPGHITGPSPDPGPGRVTGLSPDPGPGRVTGPGGDVSTQLVLVSSGAIASGLVPLGLSRRPSDLATQQAAASVGQGLLIGRYTAAFARHGIRTGQVLLSADDLMRRTHYRNAQRTLDRLLELGVLPVVNENDTVATDEIRFGDNDRLAALVAHVTRAGALILLSDVDGLYDGDPRRGLAQRITEVRDPTDLDGIRLGRAGRAGTSGGQGPGVGGMATKVEAAMIATAAGIPTVVASAASAPAALAGAPVGTYFAASGRRLATRLLWLKHAAVARGSLHLDAGAVEAVVARRASLLPAGITGADGAFEAGDPVNLLDESGRIVARGLVNYDAAEIPGIMGRSTRWLASKLGPEYQREVVHRDDLVIL
jgi:glutamate 5-kinase